MGSLEGRVAVVTGGAQGLGLALAGALRDAGATVAVLDRDAGTLEAARPQLGDDTLALTADVTDEHGVGEALAAVVERHGRLDILVNNAAIRLIAPLLEQPVADWRATLDVNLTGPFLCIRAAVPHMLGTAGRGKIVNIASVAGMFASSDRAAYSAAKAGVIMLTKSTAHELGPQGIWCNAVAPGVVETPLTSAYFEDARMRDLIIANTPVRRWAQPSDIAPAVVFLAGDASDFVQGTTIAADGGWMTGKGY